MLIENIHIPVTVRLDGVIIQRITVITFDQVKRHIFGIVVINEIPVPLGICRVIELERPSFIEFSRLTNVAVAILEIHRSVFTISDFSATDHCILFVFAEVRVFGRVFLTVGSVNIENYRIADFNVGE